MPDDAFPPPGPPGPFIGRESELEWLARQVFDREIGYGRPIVISGAPGIGKSALVAKFVDSGPRIVSGRTGTGKSAQFVRTVTELTQTIWIPGREFPAVARRLDRVIRARSEERVSGFAVVVLDGLDEMKEEERRLAVSHILNYKRVRTLIITSRTELELRGERTLHLERMPAEDAQSLIIDGSNAIISPESMQKMIGLADGVPVALKLLSALAKSRSEEELQQLLAGHLYDLKEFATVAPAKVLAVAKPVIIAANAGMIAALKRQPKDMYKLTPRQYEELIAELFRDMGYDVTLTKATRDGGKDILAAIKTEIGQLLCLVEAKRYREDREIGVSLVRTLYGTLCDYQATSAMMVTTSSYSKEAHALQQKHQYQLSLKEYGHVADWIQRYGTNKRS